MLGLIILGALFFTSIALIFFFLDIRGFLRNLFQFLLIWTPILIIFNLRTMYRRRWQFLFLVISTVFALIALHLLGPYLVQNHLLPHYEADVAHILKHRPGVTNEDGVQPDVPPDQYLVKNYNIIVLGDSYAYGAGLEKKTDAFPFLLEAKLQKKYPKAEVKVVNFGYPAGSPVLELRQLRKIGKKYKPDLVIQVISMTAFSDDIRYAEKLSRAPEEKSVKVSVFRAMKVHAGLILFGVPDYGVWVKMQLRNNKSGMKMNSPILDGSLSTIEDGFSPGKRLSYFFHMEQPLIKSEPYMETTWNEIQKTYNYAKTIGSKYVLFILPRCRQYQNEGCPMDKSPTGDNLPNSDEYLHEPFKFFEKKKMTALFPIHSLLPDFQKTTGAPTTFEDDPHFNRLGHDVAALAMAKYIIDDSLVEQTTTID